MGKNKTPKTETPKPAKTTTATQDVQAAVVKGSIPPDMAAGALAVARFADAARGRH